MNRPDNGWLIDKSALTRIHSSPDAGQWIGRANRGLIRISTITLLEVGYSARSGDQIRSDLTSVPLALLPVEYLRPLIEDRAVVVQALLADRGMHREPSIADLIIAATAESSDLTVLHIDKDFELIAEITGQSVERLRT